MTEKDNLEFLKAEAGGLALGSKHATGLKKLAEMNAIKLPGKQSIIRNGKFMLTCHRTHTDLDWNSAGAFIGRLPPPIEDKRLNKWASYPLPFQSFLAVPLLEINESDCVQTRFNGMISDYTWAQKDASDVVAAFEHYVYIKSKKTLVFSDLQGKRY